MLSYELQLKKLNKIFTSTSPQFPQILGVGNSELETTKDFFSKLSQEINRIILSGEKFPENISIDNRLNYPRGRGTFNLPLSIELKMLLHKEMIERNITKTQLANLLALTEHDVKADEWQLSKTIHLKPSLPPRYKKVQRLLDVKHNSKIQELAEAFRVIDKVIKIDLLPKD
ncbi:hypothetical protein [Mucilaginibacter polytrichastri]|uniref:Uncharacterized protein n=1 Tax=Mucilaginibacter polytrichastri TaxID=1302689 RepID=A0A1Q6A2G3_9SPHI|nr:hypothetical protein [Mucilaginibacter polytrichastri]OKS88188.1 hypothetical protein RG47T_3652 [Mucilaginibacter polytrichastri]SFT08687.1 hypothetical protein SAMN04487890_11050 [Mucilaginibacter polytrichastri]